MSYFPLELLDAPDTRKTYFGTQAGFSIPLESIRPGSEAVVKILITIEWYDWIQSPNVDSRQLCRLLQRKQNSWQLLGCLSSDLYAAIGKTGLLLKLELSTHELCLVSHGNTVHSSSPGRPSCWCCCEPLEGFFSSEGL